MGEGGTHQHPALHLHPPRAQVLPVLRAHRRGERREGAWAVMGSGLQASGVTAAQTPGESQKCMLGPNALSNPISRPPQTRFQLICQVGHWTLLVSPRDGAHGVRPAGFTDQEVPPTQLLSTELTPSPPSHPVVSFKPRAPPQKPGVRR